MQKQDPTREEANRLQALHDLQILDTAPEQDLDEIVHLASRLCDTPISLITLLDDHRQWFKAKTGLLIDETHRDFAFCAHAIHQDDIMIVEDATNDNRFANNPLVLGDPNIRFYAGMPLVTDRGYKLGTLCVIDRKPKLLSSEQQLALRTLAKQVIKQFELRLKVKELNATVELVHQQQEKLRKYNQISSRLLSIIGHDLRSPMASLSSVLKLFSQDAISREELFHLVTQLQEVINSGEDLLNNLLVWGTAQLNGDDIRFSVVSMSDLLDNVVKQNEPYLITKNNVVKLEMPPSLVISTDKNILEFVIRNLLLNANKFSANSTITIEVRLTREHVTISVNDLGIGIESDRIPYLFSWEKRKSTAGTSGEKGSGIGLKLCAELIEKLGGSLTVSSNVGQGSTFLITLPFKQIK